MASFEHASLSIRRIDFPRATPAEIEAIVRMQEQTFGEAFGQDEVIDLELAAHSEALLACVDGEPVATHLLARPGAPRFWFERVIAIDDPCFPADLRRDNVSEWDGIIVDPALRGRGLGRLLMLVQVELARALGIRYAVGLQAPMAKGITEYAGFRRLGPSFVIGRHTEHLVLAKVDDMARLPPALLASMNAALDPELDRLLALV